MARRLGDQTITVRRAPLISDTHNDSDIRDWPNAVSNDIDECYVESGTTDENLLGRDTVLIEWTVFAPPDSDILATDQVVFEGVAYAVYGKPAIKRSFSRKIDYLELTLKAWAG